MSVWNPWNGCHKYSEGCLHCYIEKGAIKHGYDFNKFEISKDFDKPIKKNKNGEYLMKSGFHYLCFQSDFFLEEADEYRDECFKMIKERSDCKFLFLTKRIDRFFKCIPSDWNDGYDNLVISCTVENQKQADYRLSIFNTLPIKHKIITIQPLIEKVSIEKYLDNVEEVVVGGEEDRNGRVLDYSWVLAIRDECIRKNVTFTFRQCGTNFIKDGVLYKINPFKLMEQARKADINYKREIGVINS